MAKTRWKMKPRLKLLIFTAVVLYVGTVLIQQEFKMKDQGDQKIALQKRILEARQTNDELKRKLDYMKSDEYVEKVARERLGWVKEGEIKFIEKKQ